MKLTENTDVISQVCILRLLNLKNKDNLDSRISYLEKNTGDDIIDTVNKIVDNKISNLNLNEINIPVSYGRTLIKEEKISENINDKSEKNNEKIKTNTLSLTSVEEEKIKSMLIRTAGGVLNGLFADEGFNYRINENIFTLYIKEDFYVLFIESKIDDINANLKEMLKADYEFAIDSYENMNNNISNAPKQKKEKNEQVSKDNSSKLREIFGDELIIE